MTVSLKVDGSMYVRNERWSPLYITKWQKLELYMSWSLCVQSFEVRSVVALDGIVYHHFKLKLNFLFIIKLYPA